MVLIESFQTYITYVQYLHFDSSTAVLTIAHVHGTYGRMHWQVQYTNQKIMQNIEMYSFQIYTSFPMQWCMNISDLEIV